MTDDQLFVGKSLSRLTTVHLTKNWLL